MHTVVAALLILASAGLIGGALAFQYGFGILPCEMCHWQRWPHFAVIALAGFALAPRMPPSVGRVVVYLCAVAYAVTAGLALYHVGVEQGLFAGTEACVGPQAAGTGIAAQREALLRTPTVRCDEVAWSLFGISLAGWNFLFSAGLAGFCVWAGRKRVLWHGPATRAHTGRGDGTDLL
ncbi:MAG: disulfide bond formation protein B [Alphaproteobacteria bacterium]|nr:disulfide bond formation protein B [Alphaproteobacteria bacterium]